MRRTPIKRTPSKRSWTEARRKCDAEGCRVCGSVHGIQAAHVVPRSIGGEQKAESIVPLCPTHHRQYDSFMLDLLEHLTYSEQAEAVRVLGIERARRRLAPSLYPGRRAG